ncbi:MAG TPA: hypothetical protein VIK91_08480, partial [Nannocystis sp.]
AISLGLVASIHRHNGRPEEARPLLVEAVDLLRTVAARDNSPRAMRDLAQAEAALAALDPSRDPDRPPEA